MELWTLQHPAVLEAVERDGVWHVSDELAVFSGREDDQFNHCNYAYQWLAAQMKKRIGPAPEGVHFPIWAYAKRYGRQNGKHDMRMERWNFAGTQVRMKLEIDPSRVMLSDYDEWHFALNYWHLGASKEDSDAFDNWCEREGIEYCELNDWSKDSEKLRKARRTIEDSWELMLDLDAPRDEDWHFPYEKRTYQATFWELRREDICSVEHFKGALDLVY